MAVSNFDSHKHYPRLMVQELQYNYLVRVRVYLGPDFSVGFDIPKDTLVGLRPMGVDYPHDKRRMLQAIHTDVSRQLALYSLELDE